MWRSLTAGTIPPRVTMTLQLATPLDLTVDYPAVLTVNGKQAIDVVGTKADSITLRNRTDHHVPYWLVVVPRTLVDTDWQRVLRTIRQYLPKRGEK